MRKILLGVIICVSIMVSSVLSQTNSSLMVVYPRDQHKTLASRIFFLGSAPPQGEVSINGQKIKRSSQGHFAPSLPLQKGENNFTFSYGTQQIKRKIIRTTEEIEPPSGTGFAPNSLKPNVNIAKLPGESVCFEAIVGTEVDTAKVELGSETIPMKPANDQIKLAPNSGVLTNQTQPIAKTGTGRYLGCSSLQGGRTELGFPKFIVTNKAKNKIVTEEGKGKITVLNPAYLQAAEVVVPQGIARSGPSTDFSRLTPLPKGTRAMINGIEGDWIRLDYGGWINKSEVTLLPDLTPTQTKIKGIIANQIAQTTEIRFPLEVAIPIKIEQGTKFLNLTLYNTIAQTDTIRLDNDPIINSFEWQQINPTEVRYRFNLKQEQQWGYQVKYDGTTLILSLRHPPNIKTQAKPTSSILFPGIITQTKQTQQLPLAGIKILLDPGHGGDEFGALGPTGYPEKEVNLITSIKLVKELQQKGAIVQLTRIDDKFVSLPDRIQIINQTQPTIAISVHYNSLPDDGNPEQTKGVGIFWYHPQAQNLSIFLQDYIVKQLNRPSYGVYWANLALARPTAAPSILLELGFMSNPNEFEWITNPDEQDKLVQVIANGISEWFAQTN